MTTLLERATQLFDKANEVLDRAIAERTTREAQVQQGLNTLHGIGTHLRLSKNQALAPNADNTYPAQWAGGHVYSAVIEEFVVGGVNPSARSALAQEFLNAIKSNTTDFGGNFWIWRMKVRIPVGEMYALPPYQRANTSSGESTLGCVIKHISGLQPAGAMFSGTKPAPAGAQLIINRNQNWDGGRHHTYSMMHGIFNGTAGQESEFLIALPGMVTGYVPDGDGWGIFPYVNQSEV
jgi:hypothetical protein